MATRKRCWPWRHCFHTIASEDLRDERCAHRPWNGKTRITKTCCLCSKSRYWIATYGR